MKPSCFYQQSQTLTQSIQGLINTYNSQEVSVNIQTQTIEKINVVLHNFLKETPSQEALQEVKKILRQVKVRHEDHHLWNQIMEGIDKAFPTHIRIFEMFNQLPTEVYMQIIEKLEDIELLNNSSSNLSPEQRFQIALRCGEELTRLDLSNFQSLDNEKLEKLQKTCPNLRFLNLSKTPIETLNLAILHSFSKLEQLNVRETQIATLDIFPKSLKELNLWACNKYLTAQELQKLNDSFSKLEKLDIAWTNIETLDWLPKSLKELNLHACIHLTAEAFQKLNDSFSKLEKLGVSSTKIATLDMFPKNLKELNLRECYDLTAEAFHALNSFSKLEKLSVARTQIARLHTLPKSLKRDSVKIFRKFYRTRTFRV